MSAGDHRLAAVATASGQAVVGMDGAGRITEWAGQAAAIFGWERDEVLGRCLADTIIPAFYRAAHRRGLERHRAGGASPLVGRPVELRAVRRDGSEFPVEILVVPAEHGGALEFTAMIRDITERRWHERLAAMQLAAGQLLMDGSRPGLAEAMPEVLRTVGEAVRCPVVLTWVPDPAGEGLRLEHAWHAGGAGLGTFCERAGGVPLPQPELVDRMHWGGTPFVVHAEMPHHNPLLTLAGEFGLRWMAVFPIAHSGPLMGLLVLLSGEMLGLDEELLGAMSGLGGQLGAAFARAEAERTLTESERRFRLLFEGNPNPMWVADVETRAIIAVNDAALAAYGYTREEFLGMRVDDVEVSSHAGTEPVRPATSCRHRLKDGRVIDVEVTARLQEFSSRPAVLTLVHDVTERAALERNLWHQAFHDQLTGLANRALFTDRLEHALRRAARHGSICAVLLLDLDDFKRVNDTRGHQVGDRLVQAVAARLCEHLRPDDSVARLGGDEFAVLLEDLDGAAGAEIAAGRVLEALQLPFHVDGRELLVGASVGVALSADAAGSDEILRSADLAMYVAKSRGKGRHQRFEPSMLSAMVEQVALEQEMRGALPRDEFAVLYQPQLDIATGRITGAEALVRWNHPTRGWLEPHAFIPQAEESRLIGALGAWVLRTACGTARRWVELGLPATRVAVNISGRELESEELTRGIRCVLDETRLPATHLELEITETAAVGQEGETLARLAELRELGVRIAIDDFGTGYSMLSRLQAFPVDRLKIDRSFIETIDLATDTAPLVAAMIGMAHGLGLTVVAEGVELTEQLQYLRGHGCDEAQGYLVGRPMTGAALEELLRRSAAGASAVRWQEPELETRHLLSELVRVEPVADRLVPALLGELERLTGVRCDLLDRTPGPAEARVPLRLRDGRVLGWLGGAAGADDRTLEVIRLFGRVIATQLG
ncbi:MAG TPA: EAL domain-containing protein [Candidatus Dormibacteraeota bacterium]